MFRRYKRLWTCERCKNKVEILGLYDGMHVCGHYEDLLREIKNNKVDLNSRKNQGSS